MRISSDAVHQPEEHPPNPTRTCSKRFCIYLPNLTGSFVGGIFLGVHSSFKTEVGKIGIATGGGVWVGVGLAAGLGLDLKDRWASLDEGVSRKEKICFVVKTIFKHIAVAGVLAAAISLSIHLGKQYS